MPFNSGMTTCTGSISWTTRWERSGSPLLGVLPMGTTRRGSGIRRLVGSQAQEPGLLDDLQRDEQTHSSSQIDTGGKPGTETDATMA